MAATQTRAVSTRFTDDDMWSAAADIDPSVRSSTKLSPRLSARKLRPRRYERRTLFDAMIQQSPILFDDFPVRQPLASLFDADPAASLRKLFDPNERTLGKFGRSQTRRYLPVHDAIDIWERNRSTFSANDVFFRALGLDRVLRCQALSDFNVLPGAPDDVARLEVATMLIGTEGAMTDSHSDDPDGCNHCIVGRKLWFVWDRSEGRRHGLQDCEVDDVFGSADFDLETFLSLRSSRWFTVSSGQTLFLPGSHTHKVLTLERYLGLSSFYLGLPNALSSLSRWAIEDATMMTSDVREILSGEVIARLDRVARSGRKVKEQWGFSHVAAAHSRWLRTYDDAQRTSLLEQPSMRSLVESFGAHAATVRR